MPTLQPPARPVTRTMHNIAQPTNEQAKPGHSKTILDHFIVETVCYTPYHLYEIPGVTVNTVVDARPGERDDDISQAAWITRDPCEDLISPWLLKRCGETGWQ